MHLREIVMMDSSIYEYSTFKKRLLKNIEGEGINLGSFHVFLARFEKTDEKTDVFIKNDRIASCIIKQKNIHAHMEITRHPLCIRT